MDVVEIAGLKKTFGATAALDGIDLAVREGEILGLLGPNGAGKSTLVRALVGRVRPDAGTIRIFGRGAAEPGARDSLGYVPQEIALYPLLGARENLEIFGRYLRLAGAALRGAVTGGLAFAELAERAETPSKHLSGGMRRRLNFAVGVLATPRLVLLDEPTVGVDAQSRERLIEMVGALRGQGVTILYTTHYMEEAERLCDRVAVVDHGRVIALGTRDELVRRVLGPGKELRVDCAMVIPDVARRELEERGAHVEERRLSMTTTEAAATIPAVLEILERAGAPAQDLHLVDPTLEEVFLHLTGRELRE